MNVLKQQSHVWSAKIPLEDWAISGKNMYTLLNNTWSHIAWTDKEIIAKWLMAITG